MAEAEQKVVLFYKYVCLGKSVCDVATRLRACCTRLGIVGRLLLSAEEGINGTVGGTVAAVNSFVAAINADFPLLAGIPFKDSTMPPTGTPVFPDLKVAIVSEIINTGGALAKIPLDKTGVGYLTPSQFHSAVQRMLDSRREAAVSAAVEDTRGKGVVATAVTTAAAEDERTVAHANSFPGGSTVLIDCRNHKECEIGRFEGAMDPNTRTFSEFPRYYWR